jgi:putative peptide zinc metalloprotease protein
MTLAPGHLDSGRALTSPLTDQGPGSSEPLRLSDGIELLGAYQDSGYDRPPSLVRRADGQIIQMSPLLYLVTSRIDGVRDQAAIAGLVSQDLGRTLSAEQVGLLLTAKLIPLGIVAAEGAPAVAPRANPLLALRARGTLLPTRVANAVGTLLQPLFRWPLVIAVVASVVALDYWIFAVHGLGRSLNEILRNPVDLLVVAGLSAVSGLFHECGHASGCRCGGARTGVIGFGIYLVYPSFFTNVTDSYRLSRAGRLRTDLGGLYFNLIFMLVLAGIYVGTGDELLLLVIAVTHLEMLEQLLPFARYDGYYILSDLVGVPDLFARVMPILRSVLRRGPADPRVSGLRRRSRVVVTSWVLIVVPLLTLSFGYLFLRLPLINRALWQSVWQQAHSVATAVSGHHFALAFAGAISAALVGLSIAGSLYVTAGLARRLAMAGWRWSSGRLDRRALFGATGLATLAGLGTLWAAQGAFTGW